MSDRVSLDSTAAMFKALGDPTRLRIYQFLRACCCPVAVDESGDVRQMDGITVGDVCCHITGKERVTSTISEHIKELREAGLVVMERRGKNITCAANPVTTWLLADFFTQSLTEADKDSTACRPCC